MESDLTVTVIESGNGDVHTPSFDGKGYYIVAGGTLELHFFSEHLIEVSLMKLAIEIDHKD